MKTRIAKKSILSLKSALSLGVLINSGMLLAQYDTTLSDTDRYLDHNSGGQYNSAQIEVDGRYDRLDKVRRNLEKKNQQMVRKKIEDVRMKNETKLTKQLQGAFAGKGFPTTGERTYISTDAAKQPHYTANLGTRIMLNAGVMGFSGEKQEIETNSNFSIGVEGDISSSISFGLAFTYTSADLVDDANLNTNQSNFNNTNQFNNNNFYNSSNFQSNNFNGGRYQSIFGEAREMSYSRMGIEAQAKYYVTRTKRFSPYFGGALSINRSKLSYVNNEEYSFNGSSFGNELYKSNSFAGAILFGAEVNFTRSFGMLIELKAGKGLGTFGQTESQTYRSVDEYVLEEIGSDIDHAVFLGAGLGVFAQF